MLVLNYTIKRLRAFLDQIDRVLGSEFAYSSSIEALCRIRDSFSARVDVLQRLDHPNRHTLPTIRENCTQATNALVKYLPLLGFILRSTNVRNAFEAYYPLLRLARDVLERKGSANTQKTRLILSSEWRYSPFIQSTPDLPGFFMIGVPATESDNPFVVPLAGHELGHAVWKKEQLDVALSIKIETTVLSAIKSRPGEFKDIFGFSVDQLQIDDLFTLELLSPAIEWAKRQTMETYCDFFGLHIFGTSFLHAFAYLLSQSQNTEGRRSGGYPPLRTRAQNLVGAARAFGVRVPDDYASLFEDNEMPIGTEKEKLLIRAADEVLDRMVPELITKIGQFMLTSPSTGRSEEEVSRILECYKRVMPAERCKSVADILNAAWVAFHDPTLWKDIPQIYKKKEQVLKSLVLKNLEIFDLEHVGRNDS